MFAPYRILGMYTALYMISDSADDTPHLDFLMDFN